MIFSTQRRLTVPPDGCCEHYSLRNWWDLFFGTTTPDRRDDLGLSDFPQEMERKEDDATR